MELVVVNPHMPTGGGLAGLIGSRALRSLHDVAGGKPLEVQILAEWMADDVCGASVDS